MGNARRLNPQLLPIFLTLLLMGAGFHETSRAVDLELANGKKLQARKVEMNRRILKITLYDGTQIMRPAEDMISLNADEENLQSEIETLQEKIETLQFQLKQNQSRQDLEDTSATETQKHLAEIVRLEDHIEKLSKALAASEEKLAALETERQKDQRQVELLQEEKERLAQHLQQARENHPTSQPTPTPPPPVDTNGFAFDPLRYTRAEWEGGVHIEGTVHNPHEEAFPVVILSLVLRDEAGRVLSQRHTFVTHLAGKMKKRFSTDLAAEYDRIANIDVEVVEVIRQGNSAGHMLPQSGFPSDRPDKRDRPHK